MIEYDWIPWYYYYVTILFLHILTTIYSSLQDFKAFSTLPAASGQTRIPSCSDGAFLCQDIAGFFCGWWFPQKLLTNMVQHCSTTNLVVPVKADSPFGKIGIRKPFLDLNYCHCCFGLKYNVCIYIYIIAISWLCHGYININIYIYI